jgi:DNA mismatch repair protein MutS2
MRRPAQRAFLLPMNLDTIPNAELEAIEFPTLTGLVARGARTRLGREALSRLSPWDGLRGLRRLRQMELGPLWAKDPSALPVVPFDEALDEVLNPLGWPLPEHWRQLREGLRGCAQLLRSIAAVAWPEGAAAPEGTEPGIDLLQVTAALLPDPMPLADLLARSFTEDGQLDPMKVPGLAELYRARTRCFQAVQNRLQKTLRDVPEAFQETNIVERNGRQCLAVRVERRSMVPGLVLDRSSSGATVFLEPFEAVQLNNDLVEAEQEYTQAVHAFLRDLLDRLRDRRFDFERWHRFQADADEALALLRWGALCDGILPDLGQDRLHLLDARHPLLLPGVRAALELEPLDHDAVPLTLELDRERPGVVISGSNTGGKTVVLKTVGLLTALARAGCAIPARAGTEVPELVTLHADIGDHQTLVGSLSTFSSHILHLKQIIAQAKRGGLVLLDELGTGTDPKEGAASAGCSAPPTWARSASGPCATRGSRTPRCSSTKSGWPPPTGCWWACPARAGPSPSPPSWACPRSSWSTPKRSWASANRTGASSCASWRPTACASWRRRQPWRSAPPCWRRTARSWPAGRKPSATSRTSSSANPRKRSSGCSISWTTSPGAW